MKIYFLLWGYVKTPHKNSNLEKLLQGNVYIAIIFQQEKTRKCMGKHKNYGIFIQWNIIKQ